MPNQPADPDPLEEHHDLSLTERKVLRRLARGESDGHIADHEGMTLPAVHSCLRRFRERTGLAGRLLTAWAGKHETCCFPVTSQCG